ncbi:MAG: ABC transporter permease [Acidobacteria bacterium]|nr:ABC transporter permease [Acidobacteriota bacterium]
MNKTFLVALREYMENIRTKTFWIGIISMPVILVIASIVPILLEKAKDVRKYAVIDESGWLLQAVEEKAAMRDMGKIFAETRHRFRKQDGSLDELAGVLQRVAPVLNDLERPQMEAAARWVYEEAAETAAEEEGGTDLKPLPENTKSKLAAHRTELRQWYSELGAEEANQISSDLDRARFERISLEGPREEIREKYNQMINEEKLFAYFIINENPVETSEGCSYVSNNLTDRDLRQWFGGIASGIIRSQRLDQKNIDSEVARWIQSPLNFKEMKVSKTGDEAEVETKDKIYQMAPVAFVYLLFLSIMIVVSMLLNNTVEEKSNRIIEVLLSSISPIQLMAGKILGIGAMSLTMVGTWVIFFVGIILGLPLMFGAMPDLGLGQIASDPVFLVSFVLYFLLGYLFYSAIIVAIGSVCNSLKEAQNMMTPVTLILIVPIITMMTVAKDPNGLIAKILTYIPPFTPFVMMNRAAGHPHILEYILSTILLGVSTWAAFWAAAKVFRIGVLMTGKPPRPKEILRWLRTSPGSIPVRKES